jgi:hypothetical protein
MAVQRDENGRVISGVLNPSGRPPKGQALTDILKLKVDKEEIAELLLEQARKGDMTAIKYIYDRVDGAPKQTLDAMVTELPQLIRFDDDTDNTEDTEADTE